MDFSSDLLPVTKPCAEVAAIMRAMVGLWEHAPACAEILAQLDGCASSGASCEGLTPELAFSMISGAQVLDRWQAQLN